MGYAFFDKNGMFDPKAYGLGPGDMLEVVVVGGGGGGSSAKYTGGNGGNSAFGSYVTARGGQGGKLSVTPDFIGQYMGGVPSEANWEGTKLIASGGGAGGYIPGATNWGGNGQDGVMLSKQLTSNPDVVIYAPAAAGSAGAGGVYTRGVTVINTTASVNTTGVHLVKPDTFCGNSGLCAGGGAGAPPSSIGVGAAGGGGSGYGAGGGGGCVRGPLSSLVAGGAGGCSGEVKRTAVKLSSNAVISVSVGGGGSGAGTTQVGNNGAPGSGGATAASGGGAGGYAGVGGRSGTSSASATSASGGGAGGCVEIFW